MKKQRSKKSDDSVIGWREWVALPELKIRRIKAKIDTGARSSSLHAFDVRIFYRHAKPLVRFSVHPRQRNSRKTVTAEAEVLEFRKVRTSGGEETLRPVILTDLKLLGQQWTIELTLANRDTMGFRMLLGRQAVRDRFQVHPGRSFLAGDGKRPKKR